MYTTLSEVQDAVREAFPDADISNLVQEGSRILGTIRSAEFSGKDFEERNRLVRERVRRKFGLNGQNLGTLVPLTPEEEDVW